MLKKILDQRAGEAVVNIVGRTPSSAGDPLVAHVALSNLSRPLGPFAGSSRGCYREVLRHPGKLRIHFNRRTGRTRRRLSRPLTAPVHVPRLIPHRLVIVAVPPNSPALRVTKDIVPPNNSAERPGRILVPNRRGPPAAFIEGVVAKRQVVRSASEILDIPEVFDVIEDVVLEQNGSP